MGLKPQEFRDFKNQLLAMANEVRTPANNAQQARSAAHIVGGRIAETTQEMAARAANRANEVANSVESMANRCEYMAAECDQWRSTWRRYREDVDHWKDKCSWENGRAEAEGRPPNLPSRPRRPEDPPSWVSLDP